MKKEIHRFAVAFRGIWIFFTKETHARVLLVIAIAVTIAGFYFNITVSEWISICLTIGLVIGAEALNSALEKLCDVVQPAQDSRIADIKDIAAGAVLFCSIIAVIIGILIFQPYIF